MTRLERQADLCFALFRNLYGAAIASFLALVAMYFLYHPPAHPLNQPISQVIKELDYVGKRCLLLVR